MLYSLQQAGDRSLANVVAHEIAHSWTGARLLGGAGLALPRPAARLLACLPAHLTCMPARLLACLRLPAHLTCMHAWQPGSLALQRSCAWPLIHLARDDGIMAA